jgi:predicted TIM-barrel fold metal-dependent hydrolase
VAAFPACGGTDVAVLVARWGRALVAARPDRLIWGSDWPHLPDGSGTPARS